MADTGEEALFDAEFLATLRRLFARLQQRRPLQRHGPALAPSLGASREFKDRRSYVRGDDYRDIDWNCYARHGRLFVRLFESVQEYHVHVLVDTSRSLIAPWPAKRVVALRAAAAIAFLALANNHRVSVWGLGSTCERLLPPRKGQGHLHSLLEILRQVPFDRDGDPIQALRSFRPGRAGNGMAFVCSDFLVPDPAAVSGAIERLSAQPVDVHLVHVLAPGELDPPFSGALDLVAVEGGEERRVFLDQASRERYRELVTAWCEELAQTARRRRCDYLSWLTEDDFESRLVALLERGGALAA